MLFKKHKQPRFPGKKTYQDWLNSVSEKKDYEKYTNPNWYLGPDKGVNNYDFSGITLERIEVYGVFAESLNVSGSTIRNVSFEEGDFSGADFSNCQFVNTKFNKTIFTNASFNGATFKNCNLNRVNLTGANFCVKSIEETVVYGISAWDLEVCPSSIQSKLVIDREDRYRLYSEIIEEGRIPMMVDDIELAQFIYYLTNHKKLRETINVMNSRSVLLLGRFKNGGLERLYRIREWLLAKNFLPMIFDFERPDSMDLVEVIVTMGGLSKFIVADLSGPFVGTELQEISNIYLKPTIVFHNNQSGQSILNLEKGNKYIHEIMFDGDIEQLILDIENVVKMIDGYYDQFIGDTAVRTKVKYADGLKRG